MSEEKKHNKPSHTAYIVRDYTKKDTGEADSSWLKVGAAWLHKDGKGFDLQLEALPVDGRLVIRLNEPKKKD